MRTLFRRFKRNDKPDSDLAVQPKKQRSKSERFGLKRSKNNRSQTVDEGASGAGPSSATKDAEQQPSGSAARPTLLPPAAISELPTASIPSTTAASTESQDQESILEDDESSIITGRPIPSTELVVTRHEHTGASNQPSADLIATSSPANITFTERPSIIDASVHIQGVTYNIGGSAVVHLHYGANISQRPEKHPLDEIMQKLTRSHNAEFDMVVKVIRGPCTPETRTAVLQKLGDWCNTDDITLYWINGMAGTGKTTIVFSLCQMLQRANLLGASFFCSRSVPDCQDINIIIPTIVFQLAQRYAPFAEALAQVLHKDADVLQRGLDIQLRKLIIEPWNSKAEQLPSHIVVVIDGLDECRGDLAEFLRVLFACIAVLPFKILITSRPEFSVYDAMKTKNSSTLSTFILHEVDDDTVQADIAKYLESELSSRTTPDERRSLTELSGSLFIYAATLARLFKARNVNFRTRIQILQTPSPTGDKSKMMASLDELYKEVLIIAFPDDLTDTEIREIKDILYIIVCAREPLTRRGVAELWGVEMDEVNRRLESLLSVVFMPRGVDEPITVFHASFPDFLLDQLRSGSFYCHPLLFHLEMAEKCLEFMKSELHQNICHLDGQPPNDTVRQDVIREHISPGLQYACIYWTDHWVLSDHSARQATIGSINHFLTVGTLCWFECLSLVGRLAVSVQSMEMLRDALDENTDLATVVYDRLRFIQHVYDVTEYSAMQTYRDALIWVPLESSMRTHYASLCQQTPPVLCGLLATWSGPDQTIDIYSDTINAITISRDGRYIISGSDDQTVRIWNVRSHLEEFALSGHTDRVCSVAISADGSRAASGSDDGNVRIWNIATHEAVFILQSDSAVRAVALSFDDKQIASGHSDGSVRVWDATNGHLIHTLEEHTDTVRSVTFTQDSTRLISGSYDKTARIWDVMAGTMEHVLRGHEGWVMSVACSPKDNKIATGSNDHTARLWDMSGNELHVLRSHSGGVRSVAFMPNGKQVVTGSNDRTLRVWDVMSGNTISLFSGLADAVQSIAVFPDGLKIASSSGGTISIWSSRGGEVVGGEEQNDGISVPNVEAESMAFSENGQRVLLLPSLRILDTATLDSKVVLGSHTKYFRGALSTSGSRAAASVDKVVNVWELASDNIVGNHLTLEGHTDRVNSLSFSHNEQQLVSASNDKAVRVWDVATTEQIRILDHPHWVYSAVFSHDDTHIVTAAYDTVHIWNAQSGDQVHQLDVRVSSVAFSPDDQHIITSFGSTIDIYNVNTFQLEHTYNGYKYWSTTSDDSSYALSDDGWIFHLSHFGDEPRRLLWIPSHYRPAIYTNRSQLFTPTSTGVQICLPREDGLTTLILPRDT